MKRAEWYCAGSLNRDRWVAEQAARLPAGSLVLDVGAGAGPYRHLFAHCTYKAQDFGQEPATVGKYTPLDYESDILAIPVADGTFDAILCTEVLEHVPDPVGAVKELGRILKPGGRLLLSAPLVSYLHQEPYHFYGGYTPYWYRKFLPQSGLEDVTVEPNMGFFGFFSQESARFSAYLDPRRTFTRGVGAWLGLTALWAVTLPLTRGLIPLLAPALDRLALERAATIGYHVTARKSGGPAR